MNCIHGSPDQIAGESKHSLVLLAEMSIACVQMMDHSRESRKRDHGIYIDYKNRATLLDHSSKQAEYSRVSIYEKF